MMVRRARKIVIYDDEKRLRTKYVERLSTAPYVPSSFEVSSFEPEQFTEDLETLSNRAAGKAFLDGKRTLFDDTAILVLDYRLFLSHPSLTSTAVAHLARCFSLCGLIVELNVPPLEQNAFDLTLRGVPESFADVNVGDRQLDNPFLWTEPSVTARTNVLRPWLWPCLPAALAAFEKRVESVKEDMAKPILDLLDFPTEVTASLPRTVASFLGASPAATTPKEFVRESVPRKDRKHISCNDDLVARIAAARISKWLECLILPGQDILVDAPHLAHRFPSLVAGDSGTIGSWQKICRRDKVVGLSRPMLGTLAQHRLRSEHWVSRPVWFSAPLFDCSALKEVRAPWEAFRPEWVFCEDVSRFRPQKECREFVALTESPDDRRWIKDIKGVDYRPNVRLVQGG